MTLYMPIGISGSGKSTFACEHGFEDHEIVCPDEYRLRLTNDMSCQEENDRVFQIAHTIVSCRNVRRLDTFFDATNLLWDKMPPLPISVQFIIMTAPLEKCLERNSQRTRVVPEHVLLRQWKNYDTMTKSIMAEVSHTTKGGWCYDDEFTR